MATTKKSRRGGARPGAGPKPFLKDAVLRSVTFEREQLLALDALAKREGEATSEIVRRACAAYLKRKVKA